VKGGFFKERQTAIIQSTAEISNFSLDRKYQWGSRISLVTSRLALNCWTRRAFGVLLVVGGVRRVQCLKLLRRERQ
jgi:hypothetical protein